MTLSVIVASYQYDAYLGQALDSLLAQTDPDWVSWVVEDGSTDGSLAIAQQYALRDKRIRVLQHPDQGNHGLMASVQLGLSRVETEWVAFLESDDTWHPDYIKVKRAYLAQHPETDLLHNAVQLFGDPQRSQAMQAHIDCIQAVVGDVTQVRDWLPYFALFNPVFSFSSTLVRTDRLRACSWDVSYGGWLDYWLWVQLALDANLRALPDVLTQWRMHPQSYNANYFGRLGPDAAWQKEIQFKRDIAQCLFHQNAGLPERLRAFVWLNEQVICKAILPFQHNPSVLAALMRCASLRWPFAAEITRARWASWRMVQALQERCQRRFHKLFRGWFRAQPMVLAPSTR
jgi:glycosyltransferase involved in cell wall biosynthesis